MRTLDTKQWLGAIAIGWKEMEHQKEITITHYYGQKDSTSFRVESTYAIAFNLSWACGPGSR